MNVSLNITQSRYSLFSNFEIITQRYRVRVKSIKFKTLVCRFIIFTYIIGAGKSSILAGSNGFYLGKQEQKIVGPIIHCSPNLTRTCL